MAAPFILERRGHQKNRVVEVDVDPVLAVRVGPDDPTSNALALAGGTAQDRPLWNTPFRAQILMLTVSDNDPGEKYRQKRELKGHTDLPRTPVDRGTQRAIGTAVRGRSWTLLRVSRRH